MSGISITRGVKPYLIHYIRYTYFHFGSETGKLWHKNKNYQIFFEKNISGTVPEQNQSIHFSIIS